MSIKILAVDDDERIRRLMEDMLVSHGYTPILASDGAEAITKAMIAKPDIILLDVMMPAMDGYTAAAKISQNEQSKDIPIVMVTALGEAKDRIKAMESGADDFMTKPVDPKELAVKIDKLVSKAKDVKERTKPRKTSKVLLLGAIGGVILAAVAATLLLTNKPKTEYYPVLETVVRQVEVEKEVVKTVIEYRDVVTTEVVEVPLDLKEFPSVESLKKWLAADDSTAKVLFSSNPNSPIDCDDYAMTLQQRAVNDGYLVSCTTTGSGDTLHMLNLATIGNEIYLIEPQTDEVTFFCYID